MVLYQPSSGVRSLLDWTVSYLISALVPDVLRFARYAHSQLPASALASASVTGPVTGAVDGENEISSEIAISGPHVASALRMQPLGEPEPSILMGFADPGHVSAPSVFSLSREIPAVAKRLINADFALNNGIIKGTGNDKDTAKGTAKGTGTGTDIDTEEKLTINKRDKSESEASVKATGLDNVPGQDEYKPNSLLPRSYVAKQIQR